MRRPWPELGRSAIGKSDIEQHSILYQSSEKMNYLDLEVGRNSEEGFIR
jgi:hypothetical protein